MASSTSIEWAANADGSPGATWNPIRARDRETGLTGTFCVHASDGCRNCYAETMQGRKLPGNGIGLPYTAPNLQHVEHYLDEKMLAAPLKRRKPTTYFLSSMTDVFGEWVRVDMIDKLWAVMALSPQHTFIVVTKRAEVMRAFFQRANLISRRIDEIAVIGQVPFRLQGLIDPRPIALPNVCLMVSVEDQRNADERIPHLLATPARWRAVSCEPLLGEIDANRWMPTPRHFMTRCEHCGWIGASQTVPLARGWDDADCVCPACSRTFLCDDLGDGRGLDWVICGGESGTKARPMHPDWARSLRDQCAAAGVPFFFKQWGEWAPTPKDGKRDAMMNRFGHVASSIAGMHRETIYAPLERMGKGRAGRLLDGVEHNARPQIGAQR